MSTKHTAGPWKANNDGPDSFTITADVAGPSGPWKLVAECYQTDMASAECTSDEIEANAQLIAAAPELLKACRAAERAMAGTYGHEQLLLNLRAAIAKAEGQLK